MVHGPRHNKELSTKQELLLELERACIEAELVLEIEEPDVTALLTRFNKLMEAVRHELECEEFIASLAPSTSLPKPLMKAASFGRFTENYRADTDEMRLRLGMSAFPSGDSVAFPIDEALAYYLRKDLRSYKRARRQSENRKITRTPVRQRKMLGPATIRRAANFLLRQREELGQAPREQLRALLKELPRIQTKARSEKINSGAWKAAVVLAAESSLGNNELARCVGVAKSVISRWRKDRSFKAEVQKRQETAFLSEVDDLLAQLRAYVEA